MRRGLLFAEPRDGSVEYAIRYRNAASDSRTISVTIAARSFGTSSATTGSMSVMAWLQQLLLSFDVPRLAWNFHRTFWSLSQFEIRMWGQRPSGRECYLPLHERLQQIHHADSTEPLRTCRKILAGTLHQRARSHDIACGVMMKRDRCLDQALQEFLFQTRGFPPYVFPNLMRVIELLLVEEPYAALVSVVVQWFVRRGMRILLVKFSGLFKQTRRPVPLLLPPAWLVRNPFVTLTFAMPLGP